MLKIEILILNVKKNLPIFDNILEMLEMVLSVSSFVKISSDACERSSLSFLKRKFYFFLKHDNFLIPTLSKPQT